MSIVLLVFTLAIILVVLFQVKKYMPKTDQYVPVLPEGQKVGIVDSLYLNFQHYFSVKSPSNEWAFKILPQAKILQKADTLLPLFPQVEWLVELRKQQSAQVQIGILEWPSRLKAREVTTSILSELLQQYETPTERARIIVPLNSPAHRILQGAYTVVLFPTSEQLEFDLWLVAVLPRDSLGYIFISKTTQQNYPFLKDDFEKVVSDFTAISKSVFD